MADLQSTKVMTMFGAGRQAKYHILTMSYVCEELLSIWICNRTVKNSEALIHELIKVSQGEEWSNNFYFVTPEQEISAVSKRRRIELKMGQEANECVSQSQLICTATNSATPLFSGSFIPKGFV